MSMRGNKSISLRRVALKDAYLINAFEKELLYLTAFDTDKLLAGFRETAGLDLQGAERYAGWESMLIGGHSLGHYMTACVRSCESVNCNEAGRQELLQILKRLVEGLKECQEAGKTGFLFGAIILDKANVELQFDYIEENKTNIITQAWVPWYTMHKIFEGLVSTAEMDLEGDLAESIKVTAKEVAAKLADWVHGRVSGWSEATHRTVLGIEYGGMNDCLYDVYMLTGKEEHLAAAHAFDQVELFERIYNAKPGDNALNNHHANTTIPKFMGALKRFVVTGEEQYFRYATGFWNMVVENHSYITGGNSEWEHFGEDLVLDKERTNCNCETCNAYNMLKMTKLLFMITGDAKYADWYENTFINSILSSQNPETGMTTYFQPMASGYYKVFGERFDKFWCCTGTGMENFSKLQESFYFEKDNMLLVNQYISSSVVFQGVEITQIANIPMSEQVSFCISGAMEGKLCMRLPYWLAAPMQIKVNGRAYDYKIVGDNAGCKGYAVVEGSFAAQTRVELVLPMKVVAYSLPDGANTYAFKYGPVVLSALLGTRDMVDTTTGVIVTIPGNKIFEKQYLPSQRDSILVKEGTVAEYVEHIEEKLVRQGEELLFKLTGTDAELTYVPHFAQYKERYGIYFNFVDSSMISEEDSQKEQLRIDTVQPGYGQYENDGLHNMTEAGAGSVGTTQGGTNRYAKAGGSFTYTMEVNRAGTAMLVTFRGADAGKSICIAVGKSVLYEAVLEGCEEKEYYDIIVPIPEEILKQAYKKFYDCRERMVLDFTFSGVGEAESAAVCQFIYTIEV